MWPRGLMCCTQEHTPIAVFGVSHWQVPDLHMPLLKACVGPSEKLDCQGTGADSVQMDRWTPVPQT